MDWQRLRVRVAAADADAVADALLEATRITVTPVKRISGVPLGTSDTLTVGVQFAPEGLHFYTPATLKITPASGAPVPLNRQLFVDWVQDGKQLGLAIPDLSSRDLQVLVPHFSGIGFVQSHPGPVTGAATRSRALRILASRSGSTTFRPASSVTWNASTTWSR
jgi:hypothetical protein